MPELRTAGDGLRARAVRDSAARLFETAGYSGTTMTDIAAAVGVLPGSLYHHVTSKEQIAVELLTEFGAALADVGRAALAAPPGEAADPGAAAQERVRRLAAEVVTLGRRHAAAIRLQAFEPPGVATAGLRAAMQLPTAALQRAWREATAALDPLRPELDPALLAFALHHATLQGSPDYPAGADPRRLAEHLVEVFLRGTAVDVPPDSELDGSPALRAAEAALARWPTEDVGHPAGDREAIVAAARTEFARRGYDATTIRDVAATAGVRMGTLYRRVESKEALLRAVIDRFSSGMHDAVTAVLDAGSTVVEAVDGLIHVFLHAGRRFEAESCIVRYGRGSRDSPGSPFHDYFLQTQQRLVRLEALLDRGIAERELRPVAEPPELALHVRSVLWLPFRQHARTDVPAARAFLRATLLRGALGD